MPIILSHMTALTYWRFASLGLLPMPRRFRGAPITSPSSTLKVVDRQNLSWMCIPHSELACKGIVTQEPVEKSFKKLAKRGHRIDAAAIYSQVGSMENAEERRQAIILSLLRTAARAARPDHTGNPTQDDARFFDLLDYHFPTPLDLLVCSPNQRRRSRKVRPHVDTTLLSDKLLYAINRDVFIVSPALLVAQLAEQEPDKPHVVASLGSELAGSYRLLPQGLLDMGKRIDNGLQLVGQQGDLMGDGFANSIPLLATNSLAEVALLDRAHRRGLRHRRDVVGSILPGSASPFETVAHVQLSLPRRLGSFGLGMPKLNEPVVLSREAAKFYEKKRCKADLLYAGKTCKIDVEPGGDAWHSGVLNWKNDNKRRQALEHDGLAVVAITWDEFVDFGKLQGIANRLAGDLGLRFSKTPAWIVEKQRLVHADLANANLLRSQFGAPGRG